MELKVIQRKKLPPENKNLSWEEAIQKVLKDHGGALHYSEIAERIVQGKLRSKVGATPAASVASFLSTSLQKTGSPYLKVAKGEYTLKDLAENSSTELNANNASTEISETGAVRAFGMFWQRSFVSWQGEPKLLGRQGVGAATVNFAAQRGIYLLHDRERVVYVGRAGDSLYGRLKAHVSDRLNGRWDRFSWFGLLAVDEKAFLRSQGTNCSDVSLLETMEAVLIESLEPPLNRRRGDKFSGAEYLQYVDPAIENEKTLAKIKDALAKA